MEQSLPTFALVPDPFFASGTGSTGAPASRSILYNLGEDKGVRVGYVAFLDEIGLDDLRQVGGKAANLGHLAAAGYRVPPGFSVKADAFDHFLDSTGLRSSLERALASLDFDDEVDPVSVPRVPVDVDLEWKGVAPPFNFKDADPAALAEMIVSAGTHLSDLRMVSRVSSEHYEQTGTVTGSMTIDGEKHDISGSGHRDHSWGVRDWSAPRAWTWLTCQFGDEMAFNLSRVAIESVDVFNGFLCYGGTNHPVRRAELETDFEEDGLTQKAVRFRFEDVDGRAIEVAGDVLTVIPLDLRARGHNTIVNEGLARYRWEGREGYGIAEYLHQM